MLDAVAAYFRVSFSPLIAPVLEKIWLPYVLVVFVGDESSIPYLEHVPSLYGKVATVFPEPGVTHMPKAAAPAVIVCVAELPLATAGIVQLVPPLLLNPAQVVELVVFRRTATPELAFVEVCV